MPATSQVSFVLTLKDMVSAGLGKVKDTLNSFQASAETLRKTSMELVSTGAQLTVFGAGLAGIFAVPVKSAMSLEKELSNVSAISGATGNELLKLNDKAQLLGRTTKYTASEAASGMAILAQAGFTTNEIISVLPQTLSLASAANLDLAKAAEITSSILRGYGMDVSELAHANDVLTQAAMSTNADITDLGSSMRYIGPIAKAAGIGFEEVTAAVGALSNAGIKGAMAGTTLRGAISRLINPTGEAKKILENLGIVVTDAGGKFIGIANIVDQLEKSFKTLGGESERTAVLMEVFGDRAGPGMAALIEQGGDKIREYTKELQNSGGVTDRIAKIQMSNLSGAFTILMSAIQGFLIAVGEPFLKALSAIVLKISDWITAFSKLKKEFGPLVDLIVGTTGVIGGLSIAMGSFLLLLGGVGLGISGLMLGLTRIIGIYTTVSTAIAGYITALKIHLIATQSAYTATYILQLKLLSVAKALAVVGVAIGAWQLGTYISNIQIFGQSISEWISDALLRVTVEINKFLDKLGVFKEIIFVLAGVFPGLGMALKSWHKDTKDNTDAIEKNIGAAGRQRAELQKQKEGLSALIAEEMKQIQIEISSGNVTEEGIKAIQKRIGIVKELIARLITYRGEMANEIEDEFQRGKFVYETKMMEFKLNKELEESTAELTAAQTISVQETKQSYEDLISSLEEGSKQWLMVEEARLKTMQSNSALELAQQKQAYDEGKISLEQYLDFKKKIQEKFVQDLLALKKIELEKLNENPEANFDAIVALEAEIVAIKNQSAIEQINIQQELGQKTKKEFVDTYGRWYELEQQKLKTLKDNLEFQDTMEQISREKGTISELEYFQNKIKRGNEYYEAQLKLAEENIIQIAEKEGEETEAYTKAIEEKKRLAQDFGVFKVQSEVNLAQIETDQQQRVLDFYASITGERAALVQLQYDRQLKTLNDMFSQGLLTTEQYEKARIELTEKAEAEIIHALDAEAGATDRLNEKKQVTIKEVADGVVAYESLKQKALEVGGAAEQLVTSFERFRGSLVLGGEEAGALSAILSGNAEEMNKAAMIMENNADIVRKYGEGLGDLQRVNELTAAAQQLRAEASLRQAMADREAALSLENLTIATQEYLGIAASAQSAISTFASDIEDLTFAVKNQLITQKKYTAGIDELKIKLKDAVPAGTELNGAINNLLGSFLNGALSLDQFTEALRKMSSPGENVRDILKQIADEMAGHSVTTSTDAATDSIQTFTMSLAQGLTAMKGYTESLWGVFGAGQAVGTEMTKAGETLKNLPKNQTQQGGAAITGPGGMQAQNMAYGVDMTGLTMPDWLAKSKLKGGDWWKEQLAKWVEEQRKTLEEGQKQTETFVGGIRDLGHAIGNEIRDSVENWHTAATKAIGDIGINQQLNVEHKNVFEGTMNINAYDPESTKRWLKGQVFPEFEEWMRLKGKSL